MKNKANITYLIASIIIIVGAALKVLHICKAGLVIILGFIIGLVAAIMTYKNNKNSKTGND